MRSSLLDFVVDGANETAPAPAIEDMRDWIRAGNPQHREALDGPQR